MTELRIPTYIRSPHTHALHVCVHTQHTASVRYVHLTQGRFSPLTEACPPTKTTKNQTRNAVSCKSNSSSLVGRGYGNSMLVHTRLACFVLACAHAEDFIGSLVNLTLYPMAEPVSLAALADKSRQALEETGIASLMYSSTSRGQPHSTIKTQEAPS